MGLSAVGLAGVDTLVTDDPTPTLTGTTNTDYDHVRVFVTVDDGHPGGSQSLEAVVTEGTWSTSSSFPRPLRVGTHDVTVRIQYDTAQGVFDASQTYAGALTIDIDANAIDILNANLGVSSYDLTGDGVTDSADVDFLVRDILGTEYGDVNLDGSVDLLDLAILGENYHSPKGWASGDFNGDLTVDLLDLAVLGEFYTFGSVAPMTVSSPALLASQAAPVEPLVTSQVATSLDSEIPDALQESDSLRVRQRRSRRRGHPRKLRRVRRRVARFNRTRSRS